MKKKERKYKQTEIGRIPEDWEQSSVGDFFIHIRSNSLSRDCLNYENGRIKNVHYGDVLVKLGEVTDAEADLLPFVNKNIELSVNPNVLLQSGDVVMADTAEDETVGKSTELINVKSNVVAGQHTIVNRPKQQVFSAKYLGYFFNSTLYHTQLLPHMQGIKVLSLSKKAIDSTIVVYPKDKQEQSRIAEALSNIDKLITSLSKMIEKKRLMKQGAMQQLLTGKKRLPGFEGEWEEKELGTVVNIQRGDMLKSSEYQFGNTPVIAGGITPAGYHNQANRTGHTITISASGANAGYIGYYKTPIFATDCSTISEDSAYFLDFIYYSLLLRQQDIYLLQRGGAQPHIHPKDIAPLKINIPYTFDEQSAIANVLTTMDNEIEVLEEERDKYIRMKEGMMQKLLTGQIRLVEAETKVVAIPKAKGANVHFKRSVLAAEIANRLCEEPTFGHVKMEKLIFLTEHLCHIDIGSHYHRDAAGPYDNSALRSIDSQMKRNKWFEAKKTEKYYRYVPLQKRGDHKKYFDKYYADVLPMFDKVIETFKTSTTEQCEIVATLYSAWNDLLHRGQPFTDDDILNEVLNHWHESKKRIPRNRWQNALEWMRNNGFAPENE